jgi:hypothetical protein
MRIFLRILLTWQVAVIMAYFNLALFVHYRSSIYILWAWLWIGLAVIRAIQSRPPQG